MSVPKRHHYIPQWQMRYWAHDDGRVLGVTRSLDVGVTAFLRNPKNVNMKRNLYSYYNAQGKKDARLETDFYSPLDSASAILTRDILSVLQEGRVPVFDKNSLRLLWQFYFYNSIKRHPKGLNESAKRLDEEKIKTKVITEAINKGYDEKEVVSEVNSIVFDEELINYSKQVARASQKDEVLNLFETIGVKIAIAPEGTNFILPDISFELVKSDSDEPKLIWIPIHPKYAISPSGHEGKTSIKRCSKEQVRKMNEEWYLLSETSISLSRQQLKLLIKRKDKGKIIVKSVDSLT